MLSQPAQTSMRCHPAHILFPIPSVPAAKDRNSLKTKAGVQYWFRSFYIFKSCGQYGSRELRDGTGRHRRGRLRNPNYKGNAKQVPIDLPSSCQEILQSGFQNIVVEELEPPIVDLNELVQATSNSCTSPSNLVNSISTAICRTTLQILLKRKGNFCICILSLLRICQH
ncbi:uncharacterized protein LOC116924928 isoform X2 [Daphnia magna]|uniref:uncharacterized protein LOC116924928 isoform X2 n=1 Tax=Daphnia magna TaxID=35525 RepID=UPI001E1BC6C6|nr:uncharacterized protein LOC116924928 isoform X2 [Daphnia magna]